MELSWKKAATNEPQPQVPQFYSFLASISERWLVRPLDSSHTALLHLGVTSKIEMTRKRHAHAHAKMVHMRVHTHTHTHTHAQAHTHRHTHTSTHT